MCISTCEPVGIPWPHKSEVTRTQEHARLGRAPAPSLQCVRRCQALQYSQAHDTQQRPSHVEGPTWRASADVVRQRRVLEGGPPCRLLCCS